MWHKLLAPFTLLVSFWCTLHKAVCIAIPAGAALVGLACNPDIAYLRGSVVAQIGQHNWRMGRLFQTQPQGDHVDDMDVVVGVNDHLKVYLMRNCALMPESSELEIRKDGKRQNYKCVKTTS